MTIGVPIYANNLRPWSMRRIFMRIGIDFQPRKMGHARKL